MADLINEQEDLFEDLFDEISPVVEDELEEEEESIDLEEIFKTPDTPSTTEAPAGLKLKSEADQEEVSTPLGSLPVENPYTSSLYDGEDPNKSDFYLETVRITELINEIQKNPVVTNIASINPAEADMLGMGFDDVALVDIKSTLKKIDDVILESPNIINSKDEDTSLVSDILSFDQVNTIQTFFDGGIQALIDPDWVDDQIAAGNADAVSELLNSALPPGITQDQIDLYVDLYEKGDRSKLTKKEVEAINEKSKAVIKVEGDDYDLFYDVYDISQLDNQFEVDEKAFKYVKDTILQNMNFEDYESFEDFAAATGDQIQELIAKDPLIAKTIANANLNLLNESTAKYIDMLNEAKEAGLFNSQADIDALNLKWQKWQEERYIELLSETDYEKRAFEYEFTTAKVLEDLYVAYGRSTAKNEDGEYTFKELDEDFKNGVIGEWWYRLRNRGINTAVKWKQGMRNIFKFTPTANRFAELTEINNFFNDNKDTIERLNLSGLTMNGLIDLAKNESLSEEDKEVVENFKGKMREFRRWREASEGREQPLGDITINDIIENVETALPVVGNELLGFIDENIKDKEVMSLIEQIDPDANDLLTNIERVLDQSNMLFMYSGMALKTINNPFTKAAGVILDLLGTTDIVAQTMAGDIWAVLDKTIKQEQGENYKPTRDDYLALLEDPDSINMISNILSTGSQLAMERFSVSKILGASKFATNKVASLVRGQFKTYLKTLPYFLTARELAGVSEWVTEGTQGLISDINQKYQVGGDRTSIMDVIRSGEFDFEGAKQGRKIARFLPLVGQITSQSAIELGQISLMVAENFNLKGAATESFFKDAIAKIRKDIDSGAISKELGSAKIEEISTIRNMGLKIPENFDGRSKKRLLNLLLTKKTLQDKIKAVDDKDISTEDILQLAEVSSEIQLLIGKANNKTKYEKQVGNILNIINNNENANVKIIKADGAKRVKNQIDRLNNQGWKIAASKGLTTNYGTIFQKGDQQVIVLNTQEILKDGAINTAAHEFLHAVLWNTVKNSKGTALALGNDLVTYLQEVNPELMKNSELASRIQAYKDDPSVTSEQQAEEVLTLFSEAVLDGAIELNDSALAKVQDFFTRIFQSLGWGDITFNSGRDVYNFIKDYNKSIKKGKFTKAQDKLFSERATGKLVKREYTTKETRDLEAAVEKSSKKLTELTNEYKDGNFDNVEDLSVQYQKTGKDALKRWAASKGLTINLGNPQVNKEVTSLLNKEFDSFTRNFDSSKAEASTYMENIAKRIGPEIVKEATRKGKQVSQDVLTEKGISPEVSVQPDIDQKQAPTGQRAKVFPNAIRVISDTITGETRAEQKAMLKNDIQEAILRVGTNPKAIAKYIVEKTKTKEYRALIKNKLGRFGSQQYIDNVYKLFNNKDFIKAIPVANIKRRFGKLFGIKQIDTVKTKKVEDGKTTYFDKQVYSIPAITPNSLNKIRQYFLAGEKRSQSLFEIIGEGIAVESMQELRMDKDFMKELQNRLDFKKSNLTAEQLMDQVEFNLDKRNLEDTSFDQVKASRKRKPSLNVQDYQRIELLIKNNPKTLLKNAGYTPYPAGGSDSFSTKQKQERNQAVLRLLPKFGLDFFNSYGWFKNNSSVFKDKTEFDNFMAQPLDVEFVKNNKAFVDKYATKKGNQYFLNENSLPQQGPALTKSEWKTLKKARTEQAEYAKLSRSERAGKLKDKNFRKLQDNKVKVLKKIVSAIDRDVRNKDGDIIAERLEFYAAWFESQANVSTHAVRVLSPIRFFSTSSIPFTTPVLKVRKKDNTIIEGGLKNYEAEHMLPVNNVTRLILDMIIKDSVNKDFEFIAENSIQGQLLKSDDNIITKAGYQIKLPRDFFDMKKPNAWIRYLLGNPNINLNSYIVFDTNSNKVITVAESLGLPLAKKDQNPDTIDFQNKLLIEILLGTKTVQAARIELTKANKVDKKSSKQVNNNQQTLFNLINPNGTTEASIQAMSKADKAMQEGIKYSKKRKGISVFDFDDTLAFSNSKVIVTLDGKTFKITPAEFANQAEDLELNGASFNFSEFNKVIKGRKGPLADLALKRQEKFGSGDIFVLTARPQLSAVAIKKFLDGIGLNIPLKNITGLENGSPEAKALWVVDKAANGYNDFYFADDALPNVLAVKNVLSQIDVKSKVQQAKSSKKRDIDREFNVIIEQQSGKEWFKEYSNARAEVEGKKANKFEFFIPPSAEDFVGLMYKVLPKGEKGNLAMRWINDNLLDPFNKAEQNVISAKMAVANDFKSLRDSIDDIPKNLMSESGYSNFTWSQALRVYIWNMQGDIIPGLSNRDKSALVKLIENNTSMKVFAEKIAFIQKDKSYPSPRDTWVGGSITSDIIDGIQRVYRKEALVEWQQNVDIIFSEKNMNKLEALYGSNYIVALKNILGRMKRGSNRAFGGNPQVDNVIDWVNNSVGTTMFLNRKSALLQMISNVNYLNWSDNNLIEAGKAFANQKQYWKDVMFLLNSDYLVQRRNGLKINVAESEIAEAAKKGGFKGAVSYLLNKGFVFTRLADSFAIATGGATFYRNRFNKLLTIVNPDTGKLYTKKEADAAAFNDFYKISEETQQSSRTDRISMQQASGLGRIILNYANTPMQYARIIKKSSLDLLAGRGDWRSNVSKIVYYGTIQNLIFNGLQQALFALAFGEEEEQKKAQNKENRAKNIGFGMLSSLLRGLGYGGALVDTLISMGREISIKEDGLPSFSEDFAWNVFDFSPTVDTKVRKLRAVRKTFVYNREEIKRRGFSLENPAYYSLAQVIDAGLNIPLDRALRMAMSLKQISDRETATWQRFALALGWSSWSVGLPYWGTLTTVGEEAAEDAAIKEKYTNDSRKLKNIGYKRIPMTRGKPEGKVNVDFIEVTRPSGDIEYWIIPKMKIK
ncbi:hypothetical protein CMK13_18025 [Candidatus Poribacteria bacterium]|nr:hypothetical protein [Candidatus Poribacteria bacterium]